MRSRSAVAVLALAAASSAVGCGGGGSGPSGPAGSGVGGPPRIVFLSDADTLDVFELFVTDLQGQDVRKVSGPTVPTADVTSFEWSPDYTRLAFRADRDVDGREDCYVVDLADDPAVPVNVSAGGADAPQGSVVTLGWSPDGTKIAFSAVVALGASALYVSDPTAPVVEPVRVSPTPPPGGQVQNFAWSPQGDRLAYLGDVLLDERKQLFSVEPDGTGHGLLSVADPGVTSDDASRFAWSPDGSRVAFTHNPQGGTTQRLLTCLPAGGGLVERSAMTLPFTMVQHFAWSPDGTRLAYLANQDGPGPTELFVTDPVTGPPLQVGPASGTSFVEHYSWSPDSTRLAYTHVDYATVGDLRVVPAAGGASVVVAGPYGAEEWAVAPRWSPASDRISFQVVHAASWDLRVVDADGSDEHVLCPAVDDEYAGLGEWSPDGQRVAFRRIDFVTATDTRTNAFVVDSDGSGAPIPLSDVPDSVDDVAGADRPDWFADSQHLVFLAGAPGGTGDSPPRRLWVVSLGVGAPSVVDVTPDPTGLSRVLVQAHD